MHVTRIRNAHYFHLISTFYQHLYNIGVSSSDVLISIQTSPSSFNCLQLVVCGQFNTIYDHNPREFANISTLMKPCNKGCIFSFVFQTVLRLILRIFFRNSFKLNGTIFVKFLKDAILSSTTATKPSYEKLKQTNLHKSIFF